MKVRCETTACCKVSGGSISGRGTAANLASPTSLGGAEQQCYYMISLDWQACVRIVLMGCVGFVSVAQCCTSTL